MQWIRASERLPKQATGKEFFIKYKGHPYLGKALGNKFCFREGTFPYSDVLTAKDFDQIEWLDEQPSPDWVSVNDDSVWYQCKELMLSSMDKGMTPEEWVKLMKGLGYSLTKKPSKI